MSDLRWCAECGTHHWGNATCFPEWECRIEGADGDGDEMIVRARDNEDAAERFLERCWSERDGWEWILGRHDGERTHRIIVQRGLERWRISTTAQTTIAYHAYTAEALELALAPSQEE